MQCVAPHIHWAIDLSSRGCARVSGGARRRRVFLSKEHALGSTQSPTRGGAASTHDTHPAPRALRSSSFSARPAQQVEKAQASSRSLRRRAMLERTVLAAAVLRETGNRGTTITRKQVAAVAGWTGASVQGPVEQQSCLPSVPTARAVCRHCAAAAAVSASEPVLTPGCRRRRQQRGCRACSARCR